MLNISQLLTVTINAVWIPRLIGRPTSVIFRLSELAARIEELAQQEEEEEIPEVRLKVFSILR